MKPFVLFLALVLATMPMRVTASPGVTTGYADLHWRLLGPHRGGWATAVAGHPEQKTTFYFGTADGGVWKTDDAGSTWHPLFDHQGSASIGALALAPSDPEVIWVGTGQIQQRWDIVDGDGIYRSTDGGMSWEHLGLVETRHIGDLWVDPRDADTALVAALGHVFGANEERGLFRTTDGGKSWSKVLYVDANTGAADIAGTPEYPDILFASLWQVRRHPWLDYFQPTIGPGSGIYRSTDAGRHWKKVAGRGLPEGSLGRIELAVAPNTGATRLWAAVEAETGAGLYRSEDGGLSFEHVNEDASLAGSYMGWIASDPGDDETVWAGGQPLRRSTDGGKSFVTVRSSPGGDDYHALWIDPQDSRRMIVGADQGAVVTFNAGRSWSSWYNQPTGQFYRLAVDDGFPYRIYSGQQDSGTVSIASRSDYGQITIRDWNPVGGDERDGDVPDPIDPNIVYGAGLGGRLSKWDARTGQVRNVSPWPVLSYAAKPGTTRYRYDWITPLAISKRQSHAIYVGAQVLFRSLDGGDSWQTISPDLTGASAAAKDCAGEVSMKRTSVCGFGTIFAISPSALADGLIWVGTTNGRVQRSSDGGEHWDDVTPAALGDWSKVNIIEASPIDAATAYVAADRHRLDERRPIIFRTHDAGATWDEIGHGLPAGLWVGVVRQDAQQPRLLYAGTNRGIFVSFDDGASWDSLQLNLPTTGINDLLVHDDDLIVATQGRAIWVLDDVAPLRRLADRPLGQSAVLLAPMPAWRLRFNQNHDTPLPPEEATGENPPVGAIIDYILPRGGADKVALEIFDNAGKLLRRFASNDRPAKNNARIYFADTWLAPAPRLVTGPGHHRFVWNLRYRSPPTLTSRYSIAAVPNRATPVLPQGALVLPGRYELRLTVDGKTLVQPLTVNPDHRVSASSETLKELLRFQQRVTEALSLAVELASKTEGMDDVRGQGAEGLSAVADALTSLATDLEGADALPTEPQRKLLALSGQRLERVKERLAKKGSKTASGSKS